MTSRAQTDDPRAAVSRGSEHAARPEDGGWRAGAERTRIWLSSRRAVVAVAVAYLLSCLVTPVLTPASVSDDWLYTKPVEILLSEGRFELLEAMAATAVFQIFWGAAFAALLPNIFGALRLATVVFVLLSGLGVYGLARELSIPKGAAALAMAAYLFNPLSYSLSYTFMTDPYSVGLLVLSSYWFLRGITRDSSTATIIGSAFAALAIIQRAHGVLIPVSVVSFLLLSRRMRMNASGLRLLLQVTGVPFGTTVLFFVYLRATDGVTPAQQNFVGHILSAGVRESALLVGRLSFIEVMYVGLFALPLMIAALPRARSAFRGLDTRGWCLLAAWWTVLVAGLSFFASDQRLMPYLPHFLGRHGIGPNDIIFGRAALAQPWVFGLLTAACAASSLLAVALPAKELLGRTRREVEPALFLVVLLVWQMAGTVLPSFQFRNNTAGAINTPSLDRYLLPILPLAVVLLVWALTRHRYRLGLAWASVSLLAMLAIIGTRDNLVYHGAIWELAARANQQGIVNERLDAGFSWDSYHLWRPSGGRPQQTATPNPPWWVLQFAPATDSSFVVAGGPLDGFDVVEVLPYSTWLEREQTQLYLLQRRVENP